MTGPGIFSYSTTPASNVQANTGINWDEGMAPAAVNNSARQNMTDLRNAFNDLIWFKYGKGDLDYSPVYASSTTFTVAGADVTTPYHIGRRVKAVGSGTGTIYGTISNVAFSTNTTVTVIWDSGTLSNETLTIYLAQVPKTGVPIPSASVSGTKTNDSAAAGTVGEYLETIVASGSAVSLVTNTPKTVATIALTAGDWDVFGMLGITGSGAITSLTGSISATTNVNGVGDAIFSIPGISGNSNLANSVPSLRISIAATTNYFLVASATFDTTMGGYGRIAARRRR